MSEPIQVGWAAMDGEECLEIVSLNRKESAWATATHWQKGTVAPVFVLPNEEQETFYAKCIACGPKGCDPCGAVNGFDCLCDNATVELREVE